MNNLQKVNGIAAYHMEKIQMLFKPGSKITVIVNPPGNAGSMDFLMTDDDLDAAIAILERRKKLGDEQGTRDRDTANE